MDSKGSHSSALTSTSFGDISSLNARLTSNLAHHGYKNLTKIQSIAIPPLIDRKNGLICSPTGSGKTLTFLIPSINHLLADTTTIKSRKDGTMILVISPTRELTQQTYRLASKLTQLWPWIVVGSITGGEKKKSEKSSLRKGITILCSTPGRLLDHLQSTNSFVFNKLQALILDEVDRLLDMGFESKIKKIYLKLKSKADSPFQKILISATINSKIESLAKFCINEEKYIKINISDDKFEVPQTLQHKYVIVPLKYKFILLIALLLNSKKSVLFVSSCAAVDYFYQLLYSVTWPSNITNNKRNKTDGDNLILNKKIYKLHGKIAPEDRIGFITDFVKAQAGILVATDVASRGLNLEVDLVIQYDPPQQLEEYIHRSGRTGRFESKGTAIMMLLESEIGLIGLLKDKFVYSEQISVEELYTRLSSPNLLPKYRIASNLMPAFLSHFIKIVQGDEDLKTLANEAYLSSIKAYRTVVSDLRHVLHFKRLHLGHLASSLNLTATPSELGKKYVNDKENDNKLKEVKKKGKKLKKKKVVKKFKLKH